MRRSTIDFASHIRRALVTICIAALVAMPWSSSVAQQIGGGVGGQQGGGGVGGIGGEGGGGIGAASGITIDAQGVLRTKLVADPELATRRKAAAAALAGDLQKTSKLRKVALSRLEAEVAKAAATGRGIPDEFTKLAGLTRVQYIFVYPGEGSEQGEIVIAGPAEPWMTDAGGRVVGTATGSPTLLLEDLATALRAFPPASKKSTVISVSIEIKRSLEKFFGSTTATPPEVALVKILNFVPTRTSYP